MHGIESLMKVLDMRAFTSLWYWLILLGLWTWAGRGALGIPSEVVRAVRRGDAADATLLLDWVALTAPRWRIDPRTAMVLTALACFTISSLAVIGFGYGRQLAQAVVLLVGPLLLLIPLRAELAARLSRLVRAADRSELTLEAAAEQAARWINGNIRMTQFLSMAAIAFAAIWGTRWLAMHPNGM